MEKEIKQLIADTENYRNYCRQNKLPIDAAACSIRLAALQQALSIIKKYNKEII